MYFVLYQMENVLHSIFTKIYILFYLGFIFGKTCILFYLRFIFRQVKCFLFYLGYLLIKYRNYFLYLILTFRSLIQTLQLPYNCFSYIFFLDFVLYHSLKVLRIFCMLRVGPGAVEAGVQLHTHFFAPSFGKQSSFVWQNLGLLNKLHTHIFVPSTVPGQ